MICEVMFQLSKTRKVQIYQQIDDKRKAMPEDSKTDDFLFGENSGKHIKIASVAEKIGMSLKTPAEQKFSTKPGQFSNWKSSPATQGGRSPAGYNQRSFSRFNRPNQAFQPARGQSKTRVRQANNTNK